MASSPTFPKPQSPTTPRPTIARFLDRGEEVYYVRIQGSVIVAPKELFEAMPSEIQHALLTTGNGLSIDTPILLRPPITTAQFRYLVYAFKRYPSLDAKKLSLDQLFSLVELSLQFGLPRLQRWSVESAALILHSPQTPLRSAGSETFTRALRIALAYRHTLLSNSIQAKWLTRLHWRELPSIPAILFADRYELRNLLGHAYYIHMVEVTEANPTPHWRESADTGGATKPGDIGEYCRETPSTSSPLTSAQRTHLLAGYYSLSAYWKRLRISPPPFSGDHQCTNHNQCLAVWQLRWAVACSQPCPPGVPAVDVLRRLKSVEDWLRGDELMRVCMEEGCWEGAVRCVGSMRDEVVRNLGHHFDLG